MTDQTVVSLPESEPAFPEKLEQTRNREKKSLTADHAHHLYSLGQFHSLGDIFQKTLTLNIYYTTSVYTGTGFRPHMSKCNHINSNWELRRGERSVLIQSLSLPW